MSLTPFHPAVARWFGQTFPQPTAPQADAWPAIRAGRHTLIAAPTGSGKTLAAFLAAIDGLVRQGVDGRLVDETQVVYVSPLKALSNDIERNLQWPLAGIREQIKALGLPDVDIRVLVRTGDTPQSERQAMRKRPPHILVTTPESLYLLLTSDSGRAMLASARSVIVDEIHAVAGSKRGSHLALSLERLTTLAAPHALTRIGLSATQKPIEEVARFLVGMAPSPQPSPFQGEGEKVHPLSPAPGGGEAERGKGPVGERRASEPRMPGQGWPGWTSSEAGKRGDEDSPAERARTVSARPGGNEGEGALVDCTIVDSGHVRQRDLALELPGAPLEAVMSGETWEQVYDRLAELIHAHRTTLVFANTRRQVERVTRHLSERLGRENVAAHHGSLSKEQRLDAEQRLKEGKLRALVATASLELGIDIGEVDLVCQLGSPRSIATFLQRVGRSGHAVDGTPKGRLFPGSRDDLVECAALLDAVRRGELDRLIIPQKPLDVLAQQIVAEVANREVTEDELFEMMRRAYPYRALTRAEFDAVVRVLSDGYATRRGRRSAYLHRDAVNRRLRGRKGARLTALTCGGAIPDNADYRVILEPAGTFIGTLNEDFAVESMSGDIFQLGNASYRILRIESGQVRVEDAKGAPPTIPFWIGEAPARTDELSQAVSRLRAALNERLTHITGDSLAAVTEWLMHDLSLDHAAARQLTDYLAAAKGMLGVLPTQDTIVLERFFDETGGMQLIVHSPFGNRINRAWGLALRKRFCRKFNFELQAAVTEDAIVLSLGETHSFALEEVAQYLNSKTVREVLIQALLAAPLFTTRWRWVATISLAIKRFHGGRKNPPPLQRIQAEDLIAVVFPDQIACAENLAGDREVPDHPLVNQTITDCLTEAMDIEGLIRLLTALEHGEKQFVARDLPHPSPLAQEILNARPYGFLDDAPLEERRTQAVMSRRWLDPVEAADFGKLDAAAIERVREEAWPAADNADELHDALMLFGAITENDGDKNDWQGHFEKLIVQRRATRLTIGVPSSSTGEGEDGSESHRSTGVHHPHPNPPPSRGRESNQIGLVLWVATEHLPRLRAIYPDAVPEPALEAPAEFTARAWTGEEALTELVRGQLQGLGPVTAAQLAQQLGIAPGAVDLALAALEGEGFALRGQFTPRQNEDAHLLPLSQASSPSFVPAGVRENPAHPFNGADVHRTSATTPSHLPEGEGGEPWRASHALHSHGERVKGKEDHPSPPSPLPQGERGASREADSNRPRPFSQTPSPSFPLPQAGEGGEPSRASRALHNIEWCERRLLARIHRYTVERLRAEIEPVSAADFLRFLFRWHGLGAEPLPEGPQALAAIVEQLEGFEASASGWEADILPARTHNYDPEWLDGLCLSGRVLWARLTPPKPVAGKDRGTGGPVRTTPIALLTRRHNSLWHKLMARRQADAPRLSPRAQSVADYLRAHGASFFDDIVGGTGLLKTQAEEALGELVATGLIHADSYAGLRALLVPADRRGGMRGLRRRRVAEFGIAEAGRWTLLQRDVETGPRPDAETVEHVARLLLKRYGVVFKRVLEREAGWLPPWYELLTVYRRLEARGEIRGGRFVGGFPGEQYALPEAVSALRALRREKPGGALVSVSAADPLNLVGILTPGARVPALAGNRVLYRDGVPIAVHVGGESRFLTALEAGAEWEARNALLRRPVAPALRVYLH